MLRFNLPYGSEGGATPGLKRRRFRYHIRIPSAGFYMTTVFSPSKGYDFELWSYPGFL